MKLPVRKCYHAAKIAFFLIFVVTILSLFEHWRGGRRSTSAQSLDPEEEYEREILEDEARIIPGLGEGGAAAHLFGEAKRLGEESEKKLAINVYLSDRIAYNRTLKDHRNPACQRVVYDAELPSASVILIFHNEPYSVVVRTIWSVLNSARRDQPWYKKANFVNRETGKTMRLGYHGQDPNSQFVYLKEIILVDDNSTLPELKGKLSHYIRTRLPPDLIKILRLPDRQGLMRARITGARAARGDALIFLDAHCETGVDWLRPLLQRLRHKRDSVLTPLIDVVDQTTLQLDAAEQFQVLDQLEMYRDIRELNTLREEVHAIRAQLATQILADFKEALTGSSKSNISPRTLSEACAVVDALEPKVKQDLIKWLISLQLQEYEHLFSSSEEQAWVSHVERRYAWLKKHLLRFEDSLALTFPPSWRLSERIALRFCKITRQNLSEIMQARRNEVDVKLLLYAIQKTYNFELLLHKRFVGTELGAESTDGTTEKLPSLDDDEKELDVSVGPSPSPSPWVGVIGACFEPHLSLYITSLDTNLRALMDRFTQDAKTLEPGGGVGSGAGAVMSSCADLFLFYKKCLAQCATLSTGEAMLELAGVFGKYLREYASTVLGTALPRSGGAGGAAGGGGSLSLVSNLHTLHTLLRDDAAPRYTKQEIAKITSVITTSEYCLETTVHLEQKLKEKISPNLSDKIDLAPEQDLFHKMISNCIQLLVQDLEMACEPALQTMTKISWLNFDNVGDQSSYVTQIIMHLKNTVPNLRDNLASSRKYFTHFCIRFANSFIPKFIQNIYKCKPISTVGSEQLLLDTHMLKTALLELPSIGSDVKRQAPSTYTKVVIKLMTKAEMILKLVMAPLDGNLEGFVSQFVQLLPESTLAEFHKVLDMKCAKLSKAQLSSLDVLFKEITKTAHNDISK